MTDNQIEQEIQDKGLTAPRITPTDIEASILLEYYFNAADSAFGSESLTVEHCAFGGGVHPALDVLTFCVLVLKNGFTVTGESACASPKNFDEEVGRKIARQNAVNKIWPLMGYSLKEQLHNATL